MRARQRRPNVIPNIQTLVVSACQRESVNHQIETPPPQTPQKLTTHRPPGLSDLAEAQPPYRETGVAISLSHCVSCGTADDRCYTPTSFHKNGLSQSEDRPNKGGVAERACL